MAIQLQKYYPNGVLYIKESRINGKRVNDTNAYNVDCQIIHNLDYSLKGDLLWQCIGKKDGMHNSHGPAIMSWYDHGSIRQLRYVLNGQIHCSHGSAHIIWYSNNIVQEIHYKLNGKSYYNCGISLISWGNGGRANYINYNSNSGEVYSLLYKEFNDNYVLSYFVENVRYKIVIAV